MEAFKRLIGLAGNVSNPAIEMKHLSRVTGTLKKKKL